MNRYQRKEQNRQALAYCQMLSGHVTPKDLIEKFDLKTYDYLIRMGRIQLVGEHLQYIDENSPSSHQMRSKTQDYQNRTNS